MTQLRTTRMKMALTVAGFAMVAASCGDSGATTTLDTVPISDFTTTTVSGAGATLPANYEGFRAQDTACGADRPPPIDAAEYDGPEDQRLGPDVILAVIDTSCGDIVVELDPAAAPDTVNSFVFLAREGFFDGGASHRISPNFVIQAGDPTATGLGGPGYVIRDEPPPSGFLYERGVVAMANAGPGSTGSQFFIMIQDGGLPPQFNVLGKVVDGFDVIDRIAALPIGINERGEPSLPLQTLYLNSITVE